MELNINKTEDIKEYQKEYYLKKHKVYLMEKIKCTHCDKMEYRGNITRHIKNKHKLI